MTAQLAIMITASQNGKKPLCGPSLPQPMPRRAASTSTSAPSAISSDAVIRSAARMLFLEQAFLCHQLSVELLIFLEPLDVFSAGGECRFQGALREVFLKVRRVVDLFQEIGMPGNRFFGECRAPRRCRVA